MKTLHFTPINIMEIVYGYILQLLSLKAIKSLILLVVAAFSYLIGGIDVVVVSCLWLIFIDFALGLGGACYRGEFQGKRMMQGLVKFILYGVAMIIGNQIDILVFHHTVEFFAKNGIILYIGINDGISGLKHLGRMGFKIPQQLINRLQGIQDAIDFDPTTGNSSTPDSK